MSRDYIYQTVRVEVNIWDLLEDIDEEVKRQLANKLVEYVDPENMVLYAPDGLLIQALEERCYKVTKDD